jgi:FAD/FMN-containing dehydrogenase
VIDPGVGQLREQARAAAITASDPGYDQGRAMSNGMSGKHPLVVIRAERVADVMAGMSFARDAGLELAVRGGGHGAPGSGPATAAW